MWNYEFFIPTALALAFLAIRLTREDSTSFTWKTFLLGGVLWVLSWFSVVALLYAEGTDGLSGGFVLRRDAGYWGGSALLFSLPFLTTWAAASALSLTDLDLSAKRLFALAAAAVACFFIPWLFSAGWILGCVVLGYSQCL